MQVSGVDEVTGDYRNRIRVSKSPTVDIENWYGAARVSARPIFSAAARLCAQYRINLARFDLGAQSTFTQWICLLSFSRQIVR